jgi:hypothetical protein
MSKEAYLESLRSFIRKAHGVDSKYRETLCVIERFQDKTVWEVEVFDLIDHPKAKTCYAWVHSEHRKCYTTAVLNAMLELPPVVSAKTAVQQAIASRIKKTFEEVFIFRSGFGGSSQYATLAEAFNDAWSLRQSPHEHPSSIIRAWGSGVDEQEILWNASDDFLTGPREKLFESIRKTAFEYGIALS